MKTYYFKKYYIMEAHSVLFENIGHGILKYSHSKSGALKELTKSPLTSISMCVC